MDLCAKIAITRDVCTSEIRKPPLRATAAKLESAGLGGAHCIDLLRSVLLAPDRKAMLRGILRRIGADQEPAVEEQACLQRVLLVHAALVSLNRLDSTPVTSSIRSLVCDEFQFFARPSTKELPMFRPENYPFEVFCKIALLERFPAGLFHWEISGIPRSWLFKLPLSALPKTLTFVAAQLKGLQPCFVPHIATRRKNRLLMSEKASDKSWHRMARCIEMQPGVKGLIVSSWLHSPDTFKVSPHLAFMNKPFVESGAMITTMGKATEDAGYLTGSEARRKRYETGEFTPTLGLVLWSRDQMIRWARAHPELNDE